MIECLGDVKADVMELADVLDSKSPQLFFTEYFGFLPRLAKIHVVPTFQHFCISILVEKILYIYRFSFDFFYQI